MRTYFPVEELARDERFSKITMRERMADARTVVGRTGGAEEPAKPKRNNNRLVPSRPDASDAARGLMHGIFVGEIQALEGAGRTCHDFAVSNVPGTGPTGATATRPPGTRCRSRSSWTWPARRGTRPATSRSASS